MPGLAIARPFRIPCCTEKELAFMKIIGEKINGTLKHVGRAIEERDAEYISNLARDQEAAGADWLDINAGTHPDRETEDLLWLIDCVQPVVEIPLCLDSANPAPLAAAVKQVTRTPMINSISLEPQKLEGILPIVAGNSCDVVALAMDENGIPEDTAGRIDAVNKLIGITRENGIRDSSVFIDPLVMAASTNTENGIIVLEAIRLIKEGYPDVHVSVGLSNISFGLPMRSLVNQTFLTLAIQAGLDTAILNPMDKNLKGAMLSAELVLGKDRHCQRYSRAYKRGLIGSSTG